MVWVFTLIVVAVAVFVLSARIRRLSMYSKAKKYNQKGLLKRKPWSVIPFHTAGTPMRMMVTEVTTKGPYMMNFKGSVERFVSVALIADDDLNADLVQNCLRLLYIDPANITFEMDDDSEESRMVKAAILYGLLCTQQKGSNIQSKLMHGNNHAGSEMYVQQKSDKEYFEYMNKNHVNFCQLVSILEPKKSTLIETVAGYLILDK